MKRLMWGVSMVSWVALSAALAQDQKAAPEKPVANPVIPQQLADDEAPPFEPVRQRTTVEQQKVDSQAWFMAGQVRLQREQYRKAKDAFEEAKKLDPTNPQIYRSLVEAAMHLGDTPAVMENARKAVELDPDDVDLLRQLAVEFLRENKGAEAIKYLEQALKSPKLDKKSGNYVLLNRDLGVIYNMMGEFDKAADHFEVLLAAMIKPSEFGLNSQARQELVKNRATSYEEIGAVFIRAKRADKAIQALEMAVKDRRGKSGPVNFLLAQVYHDKGDHERALQQLDAFFGAQLKRGRAPYQLLGSILDKLGKGETLVARLQELAEKDARNKDLQFFLADTYLNAKDLDKAEVIYRKSLEDSASTEAYLGLARIYRKQNKAAELLDNLAKAFERNNEQEQAVAQAFEEEIEAISKDAALFDALLAAMKERTKDGARKEHYSAAFVLATIAGSTEKVDAAVELYDIALKANRSAAERIYGGKGAVLSGAKRYDDAIVVYKAALEDPLVQRSRPDMIVRLARVQSIAGKYEDAVKTINELKKINPDHPIVLMEIARVHYFAHKWEAAKEAFEDLIKRHPDGGEVVNQARMSLSNVYVQLGDLKKGEEVLEAYLVDHPDDPGVNNDLGYLYADQGKNLEKAKAMIEKAVKAEPKNAAYLDSMGWVLFKLGQHNEAKTYLEKATQTDRGGDATIWDHLGDVQLQLKEVTQARQSWERALKTSKEEANGDEKLQKKLTEKLELHKPADAK